MKNKFIITIILLQCLSGLPFSSPGKIPMIQLKMEKSTMDTIVEQSKRIDVLEKRLEPVEFEFNALRAKIDFYGTDLENITAIFSVIVGAMLSIAFVFSYLKLQSEKREIHIEMESKLQAFKTLLESKMDKHIEHQNSMLRKQEILDLRLSRTQGNTFASIATIELGKGNVVSALSYHIKAAGCNYLASKSPKIGENDPSFKAMYNNLSMAVDLLDKVETDKQIRSLNKESKDLFKEIDGIKDTETKRVKDILATLRVKINSILEKEELLSEEDASE